MKILAITSARKGSKGYKSKIFLKGKIIASIYQGVYKVLRKLL